MRGMDAIRFTDRRLSTGDVEQAGGANDGKS
jgi:hypothetical protein